AVRGHDQHKTPDQRQAEKGLRRAVVMAINPIARNCAQERQRQEKKPDNFVPKRPERPDHLWHDVMDQIHAVFYNTSLGHTFILSELSGALIALPFSVDRTVERRGPSRIIKNSSSNRS